MPPGPPGGDPYLADRKRALRARMRAVTRVIAADRADRAVRSARACDRLAEVVAPLLAARDRPRVLVFRSWRTEVDLQRFLGWCTAHGVGLYVPELVADEMVPVTLAPTAIPPGVEPDPADLHVVVVPGLAFTADGHRLGRGGGHYDRFLRRVGDECLRVGVCFREQIVAELPLEPHDVRLDRVVTD